MEKKNRKMLIIALTLSLITAALIYIYISGIKPEQTPEKEYIRICTAARTINGFTQISASDVTEIEVDKELYGEGMVTDKEQIIGKWALQDIAKGEFIRKERLGEEESLYFSYSIPAGTRAVSMNITEQVIVANLLRPGDHVGVIASFNKEEEVYEDRTVAYPKITKIILQNIEVLALGQDRKLPAEKFQEQPTTITLAIKKEDVEKFVYATEYGIIRLALRPAGDNTRTDSQGAIREDVTGMKGVIVTDNTDSSAGASE